jgi:hypothetical protein
LLSVSCLPAPPHGELVTYTAKPTAALMPSPLKANLSPMVLPRSPQYLVLPPRTLLPTSTPIAICTNMMGRLSPPARSFAL